MISVNGTSIQWAIDAAQAGETIAVAAGGYAGFRVTKPLTIVGTGAAQISGGANTVQVLAPDVTLQGLQIGGSTGVNNAAVMITGTNSPRAKLLDLIVGPAECYGVRCYQNDQLTMRDSSIGDIAVGVQLHRRAGGSIFENVDVHDASKMVTDVDGGANGGNAFQFYQTAGPILVRGGTHERLRAASKIYKPVDGGSIEIFGAVSDLTIEDVIVRDAVNLTETGKAAADADPQRVTFRRVKFFGNDSADPYFVSSGAYIRTGRDFVFDACEFDRVDWFAFLLTGGGNFGGVVSGFRFVNNTVRLSSSQAYRIDLPNSAIAQIDGNHVYLGKQAWVADVRGTHTSDIAQFRTLTGQSAPAEYWGPEIVTPPVDPCADVKADLAAVTAQRDALRDIDKRALATLEDKRLSQTTRIQRAKSILREEAGV